LKETQTPLNLLLGREPREISRISRSSRPLAGHINALLGSKKNKKSKRHGKRIFAKKKRAGLDDDDDDDKDDDDDARENRERETNVPAARAAPRKVKKRSLFLFVAQIKKVVESLVKNEGKPPPQNR
jgi:hypothetical protein